MDKIGKLITENEERDAIHIAIAPVRANHNMLPGQHIGLVKDDGESVGINSPHLIGIVDPFLSEPVKSGQKFWMFLYPNTITSLKHVWSHPSFNQIGENIRQSREWMANWAAQYGWSIDIALAAGDNREFFLGEECYDEIPDKFWYHYGIIRYGKPMTQDEPHYFHCAC